MVIEVLDKHYGGLTTLKNVIDWCGTIDKTNADKIFIRFRKKDNDMDRVKQAVLLRIFEKGKTAYVPVIQLFDNYSDEEAEIIGNFKLIMEVF